MFVYFARPIDQTLNTKTAGAISMLNDVSADLLYRLTVAKIGAFLPFAAYSALPTEPTHARFIDQVNRTALLQADALVAVLPFGIPTLGTPVEIDTALALRKPVVVFTDIFGSVQLAAWQDAGAQIINTNLDKMPDSVDLRAMLNPIAAANARTQLLVKYEPGARRLTRAYETDAGLDLAALQETVLHSGAPEMIRTGVRVSTPDGWWGQITGRSSARTRFNIEVHDGVIDAGYTGELMIRATYCGVGSITVEPGTRLAQYILHPVWDGEVVETDELPEHPRGENGYGSSGH